MSEAKTYLQAELSDNVPQKMILTAQRSELDKSETVLAVFGKEGTFGAAHCLIATDDRLLYFNNTSLTVKKYTVMYDDLSEVRVVENKKNKYIVIVSSTGTETATDIEAASDSIDKMLDFINGYKATGSVLIKKRLESDPDYAWKVDAVRKNRNLKSAKIEHEHKKKREQKNQHYSAEIENVKQDTAEKIKCNNEQYEKKSAEIDKDIRKIHEDHDKRASEIDEAYNKRTAEINLKFNKEHEENQEKINQLACHRNYYSHKLDYRSGLDPQLAPCPVVLTMDGTIQSMAIAPKNHVKIQIPFSYIKGSYVTTDEQLPSPDVVDKYDDKTVYTFVLHIKCEQEGNKYEIAFSKRQKQSETVDIIGQLNYAMQHIDEIIARATAENEKDSQLERKLDAQREVLIARKAEQMNDLHNKINAFGSDDFQPSQAASDVPNKFDEIKKFKDLLDQGIISQEEFDSKKKQLLGL